MSVVVVWGKPDCERCRSCKDSLTKKKILFTECDLSSIADGTNHPVGAGMDALVALLMNDGEYPIVQVGVEFYPYPEVLPILRDSNSPKK